MEIEIGKKAKTPNGLVITVRGICDGLAWCQFHGYDAYFKTLSVRSLTPIPGTLTVTFNVDDVREEVRLVEAWLSVNGKWTYEATRRNYETLKSALEQYDREQA